MTNAFKKGDKVIAVHAPESLIPIVEGLEYTVASYFEKPAYAEINGNEPGVKLEEVRGAYMAKRFVLKEDIGNDC